MLLGGVNDQYRRMYEQSIEVAKKHLLFRPMTPDNLDILISGSVTVSPLGDIRLDPEGTRKSNNLTRVVETSSRLHSCHN